MKKFLALTTLILGCAVAQSAPVTSTSPATVYDLRRSGVTVKVWLSQAGLGLLVLPRQAVAAVASPVSLGQSGPQMTIAGLLGAVDGGASSQGWRMDAYMAGPMVVNLGPLNLTYQAARPGVTTGGDQALLGVRLGVMNTTVPMICDGVDHTVLQLDSRAGDYSLAVSRIGVQSDTLAARIDYRCQQ